MLFILDKSWQYTFKSFFLLCRARINLKVRIRLHKRVACCLRPHNHLIFIATIFTKFRIIIRIYIYICLKYGSTDQNSTDHFQCDHSNYRPLLYRLLLKLHILCSYRCTFISKLKKETGFTTHVDFIEGINDDFKEGNDLISAGREMNYQINYGREMNYQTETTSNFQYSTYLYVLT